MTRVIIQLLFYISLQHAVAGQTPFDSLNFADVDNFVVTVKYQNDIIKLARDLGSYPGADVYKVRAIFKWITNNISFDYRFVNKGNELVRPECDDDDECLTIQLKWENDYLQRILRNRRAIADGYSKLFKRLCGLNYIQAEVIPGYAKTKPYQVGNNMPINHSWNAVIIDTSWYYLDATWAAGTCIEDEESGMLQRFVRDYKNYYWLSSFERFSRNHFPQTNKWVVKPNLSKEQFFNKPYYFSVEILENLTEYVPTTGVLKVKKGDTIYFKFDYIKDIRKLQINSNIFRNPSLWTTVQVSKKKSKVVRDSWAEKKQVYIPFKKNGNTYSFFYVVTDNSLYYLELSFDYKPAIRYRVRVESKAGGY
ncbi:MAG: hypothetical protein ABIO04_06590 [Ferruginibacter sp.]